MQAFLLLFTISQISAQNSLGLNRNAGRGFDENLFDSLISRAFLALHFVHYSDLMTYMFHRRAHMQR